jgi:hypothetical protein
MSKVPADVPDIEARPVLDHRGFVVLFDLWVAGKWVGSRRTALQCEEWLTYLCGVPIEAAAGRAW